MKEVIEEFGGNYTDDEDIVPWSRGKRDGQSKQGTPFCIVVQPDERTTGETADKNDPHLSPK